MTVSRLNVGKGNRGYSLMEIIIASAMLTTLTVITVTTFTDFRARKARDAATAQVLGVLSRAYLDTITSKNDLVYGVQLRTSDYILFLGSTAPASDTAPSVILRESLSAGTEIANISLTGGGSYIYFQRLTGSTLQNGTFEIRAKGRPTISTTATVSKTGAVAI